MTDVMRRSASGRFQVPRYVTWGVVVVVVLSVALLWGMTAFAQTAGVEPGHAPAAGALPDYLNVGVGLYAVHQMQSAIREASMIGRDLVQVLRVGGDRADQLETAIKTLPPQLEQLTNELRSMNATNARRAA